MAEDRRETVIVEGDKSNRSSYGWLVALGVIAALLIIFYLAGGFNMLSGANTGGSETINVDAPDTVNVQPSSGQ
jgi:hypothetical protein